MDGGVMDSTLSVATQLHTEEWQGWPRKKPSSWINANTMKLAA